MKTQIKQVQTPREFKAFVRFPYRLYSKSEYWIPPLIKSEIDTLTHEKNPAFEYCDAQYWLACQGRKVVGRVAGIINHKFVEKWGQKYAGFSRLDFIDDKEVSQELLKTIEAWARSNDLQGVHGPVGFTNFDHQGMLVEGFSELPTIASTYNYDYYPQHLENHGYSKEVDYLEFEVMVPDQVPEKLERLAEIVLKRNKLKIFKAKSKKELLSYGKQIFHVINETYRDLFASVDYSEKLMDLYVQKYFSFIAPEYVTIVLNQQEEVVGFQVTMPSLSRAFQKARGRLFPFGFLHILNALKKPKHLDLYLIGILPKYQNKGVTAILMSEMTKLAIKNNIISAESNSELEDNKKVQDLWEYYDSRQHKRKRVYLKTF